MKPIEPGCLAIVLSSNPEFAGMPVTVIERALPPRHRMPNGIFAACSGGEWVIETPRPVPVTYSSGFNSCVTMGTAHEKHLLRIDGGEPESVESEEDRGVLA